MTYVTRTLEEKRDLERLREIMERPLRTGALLMPRSTYVEALRIGGVSEEEITRRLAVLDSDGVE